MVKKSEQPEGASRFPQIGEVVKEKNKSKGLEALSPAKYQDHMERLQAFDLNGYWQHITSGKSPTAQESKARAMQIATQSGFDRAYSTPGMFLRCEAGVPIEIKFGNVSVSINPDAYSNIELSRINGDNSANLDILKDFRGSIDQNSSPQSETEKKTKAGKPFIADADDF